MMQSLIPRRIKESSGGSSTYAHLKRNITCGNVMLSNFVADVDLADPEVTEAATKIQAAFKGYQTRKQIQEAKGLNYHTHRASIR